MGVTTYFFVKAARVLGTDSFAFADALKGRVAAQAITVGFILVGAWSLKRESYNKQVASSMVNGKLFLGDVVCFVGLFCSSSLCVVSETQENSV